MSFIFVDYATWAAMQASITSLAANQVSMLAAITSVAKDVKSIATTVTKLERQMSDLSDAVAAVSADLDALSTKLDTETTEIGKVIALLQQGNPDVPAAVTALQGIHTRVGTLSATVDQHVSTLDAALPPATPAA